MVSIRKNPEQREEFLNAAHNYNLTTLLHESYTGAEGGLGTPVENLADFPHSASLTLLISVFSKNCCNSIACLQILQYMTLKHILLI